MLNRHTPQHIEATAISFYASFISLSRLLSTLLGAALGYLFHVHKHNYTQMYPIVLIQCLYTTLTTLGLFIVKFPKPNINVDKKKFSICEENEPLVKEENDFGTPGYNIFENKKNGSNSSNFYLKPNFENIKIQDFKIPHFSKSNDEKNILTDSKSSKKCRNHSKNFLVSEEYLNTYFESVRTLGLLGKNKTSKNNSQNKARNSVGLLLGNKNQSFSYSRLKTSSFNN